LLYEFDGSLLLIAASGQPLAANEIRGGIKDIKILT